jgi:hypothetical protein
MIKLIKEQEENYPRIEVQLNDDADIPELLTAVKSFMLACGYCFKGDIILEEEE